MSNLVKMSRTHQNGFKWAVHATSLSDVYNYQVGASLLQRTKLISLGWNTSKTHPKCPHEFTQHAEFNLMIGLRKEQIRGCRLYVARLTKAGKIGIAKPCEICQKFLVVLGLRGIYYTNNNGKLERME